MMTGRVMIPGVGGEFVSRMWIITIVGIHRRRNLKASALTSYSGVIFVRDFLQPTILPGSAKVP